jgi:hypothetical protein
VRHAFLQRQNALEIFEGALNPDILIDFGAGRTAIR